MVECADDSGGFVSLRDSFSLSKSQVYNNRMLNTVNGFMQFGSDIAACVYRYAYGKFNK